MFKATLVVESADLTLNDISETLGRAPDSGWNRGERSPVRGALRKRSVWQRELHWPTSVHAGTEGLPASLEALDHTLASNAAHLASLGCDVVVGVVQDLEDSSEATGIALTPKAIGWMAAACATLSIDQYVNGEPT